MIFKTYYTPWRLLLLGLLIRTAKASLTFHPLLDPSLVCADGSPFGIYVEDSPVQEKSRNHVLVFMGGGSCTSPENCLKDYQDRPFVFSTAYNPTTIQGDTLLSRDPLLNPTMFHYTKWLIPYCSQDFFLGGGAFNHNNHHTSAIGNFTHAGSLHFHRALAFWARQVRVGKNNNLSDDNNINVGSSNNTFLLSDNDDKNTKLLDNVVVVGISAGAVGLMNHVPQVRAAVNWVGTRDLRLILDAPSVVSDNPYKDRDFEQAMTLYTNLQDYPLCDPQHPMSVQMEDASVLPCCLSTHCLIRHDQDGLNSFLLANKDMDNHNTNNNTRARAHETLLILDSAYDMVDLLGGTNFLQNDDGTMPFGSSNQEAASGAWQMVENAGAAKARAKETASAAKGLRIRQVDATAAAARTTALWPPRFQWIVTSCIGHSVLVPSVEFLFLACQHANYEINGFKIQCKQNGQAPEYSTSFGLKVRVWRTAQTWNQVRFHGQSIHEIIQAFLQTKDNHLAPSLLSHATITSRSTGSAMDLRFDQCNGPNCLDDGNKDDQGMPSCQSMIETVGSNSPVPIPFQVFWITFLVFLVVTAMPLRLNWAGGASSLSVPEGASNEVPTETFASEGMSCLGKDEAIHLRGINVVANTSEKKSLLHDVDLEGLKFGKLTGLVGRSGSGKSVLLKVLSENHPPNMEVSFTHGRDYLKSLTKAYLCQEDPLMGFGNLHPIHYLLTTAVLYKARPAAVQSLCDLVQELFSRGDVKESEKGTNPFFDSRIGNLSGGQRRILAIAALLLRNVRFLLLDEPLSGLDHLSSLQVVAALESLATFRNCAVLLSIHSPSKAIVSHIHKIIILDAGRLASNQDVMNPQTSSQFIESQIAKSHRRSLSIAQRAGSRRSILLSSRSINSLSTMDPEQQIPSISQILLEEGRSNDGPNLRAILRAGTFLTEMNDATNRKDDVPLEETSKRREKPSVGDELGHTPVTERARHRVMKFSIGLLYHVQQVRPLARRMHLQYGPELLDGLMIFLIVVFVACVLTLHNGYVQAVLGSSLMVIVPTFLFTHKIFGYNELWLSHKHELDDKRVSSLAFQIASALFTFPIPLLTMALAIAACYAILGWHYKTCPVQVLFAAVHLLVALQFGRVLAILFRGNYGTNMKVYTAVLLLNAVFSSTTIPSYRFPDALQFCFILSTFFWAVSGSTLNILDNKEPNDENCFDFFSCIVANGNVAGRVLGFSPLSNSHRALRVLTVFFVVLVMLESALLYYRSQPFPWGKAWWKRRNSYRRVQGK